MELYDHYIIFVFIKFFIHFQSNQNVNLFELTRIIYVNSSYNIVSKCVTLFKSTAQHSGTNMYDCLLKMKRKQKTNVKCSEK